MRSALPGMRTVADVCALWAWLAAVDMVRSTRTVDHACLVACASAAPARAPYVLGQLRAALACVAVVLAALPTAWVEAAAGGAALTVLRPLRQFSPLPQEGERAAVVEILRLVGWQLPGIITPAGWRRGRPGLRSTAARPAPQPAAAGGGAAGEPRWVGFAHGPGVVGKLSCKLAVALQLRAVVDERRVRRAATVEAALALDHGPHGGPRASDVQVCAGLRGLEAAVPALWQVPLLNARKDPIWQLWGYTCTAFQALPPHLRSAEDAALLNLSAALRWKKCPSCGHMVSRTSGCPHMTCLCGAEWCYKCGLKYHNGSSACPCF
ncbi:hypothetical protein FOA52_002135 [Chlamydomonas sp. UWO 241]|nr:hypothetical protein FOA52_002135 [Chlamydomonas sp. UWO 241]